MESISHSQHIKRLDDLIALLDASVDNSGSLRSSTLSMKRNSLTTLLAIVKATEASHYTPAAAATLDSLITTQEKDVLESVKYVGEDVYELAERKGLAKDRQLN